MKTLESFDTGADDAGAVPTISTDASFNSSATVIRADFELFHNAPSPNAAAMGSPAAEPDDVDHYQLGIAEGERRAGELHAATLQALQTSLTHLQDTFTESLEDIKAQNSEAVTQIFGAIFPALSRHSFLQDFQLLLQKLLEAHMSGQMLICASEVDAPQIETLISSSARPDMFKLATKAGPSGALEVTWDGGGARLDYSQAAQNAQQLLTKHFDTPTLPLDVSEI